MKAPFEVHRRLLLCLYLLWFVAGQAMASEELDRIVAGHWLQLRGQLDEQGVFQASQVELLNPRGEEYLIATASASPSPGEFMLLGQAVQVSAKTRYVDLAADAIVGTRIKVSGHYRGAMRFSARKITARKPGRDRIVGMLSAISRVDDGYLLEVMKHKIHVKDGVSLRHDKPIDEYDISSLNIALPAGKRISEDDQFGDGLRISDRLRFTTLLEAKFTGEDNYNLDNDRDRDRRNAAARVRGRFVLAPGSHGISAQFEFRHTRLQRKVNSLGSFSINDTRIGESFVFLDDPFDVDFDIQAGRMDFDDRREWLYDQDLDGVRFFWKAGGWLAELSATTTLSDGKPSDENTNNFIAYVSDSKRHLAAYVIYRDTDLLGLRRKAVHIGARAFYDWPPEHESWLEISRLQGSEGDTSLGGWGVDIGTLRNLGPRWYTTLGWAYGQGDASGDNGTDNTFRQTRLQDNNGRFGGVTTFLYYGELMNPELANLHIGTLSVGYRFTRKGSIDLVGHYYMQDKAARRIINSDLNQKPNGIDRELGWEVDAVLGWRPVRAWDFEFIVGWFKPGKAFSVRDDAWFGKAQIRYRY